MRDDLQWTRYFVLVGRYLRLGQEVRREEESRWKMPKEILKINCYHDVKSSHGSR